MEDEACVPETFPGEVTRLLVRPRRGDAEAPEVFLALYGELRRLACSYVSGLDVDVLSLDQRLSGEHGS